MYKTKLSLIVPILSLLVAPLLFSGAVFAQTAQDACIQNNSPTSIGFDTCVNNVSADLAQCDSLDPDIVAVRDCIDGVFAPFFSDPGSSGAPIGIENIDCDDPGELTPDNCGIIEILGNGINFLSALAGLSIVASIMIAGYQYMTARDNPGQVAAARTRIIWALVALLIFLFFFTFLQWVVPGGVL